MNLGKFGVVTTIVVSFIEAAAGSPSGAVVFWLTLFSAAMMSGPDGRRTDERRRFM